jgi:hypothetical protein
MGFFIDCFCVGLTVVFASTSYAEVSSESVKASSFGWNLTNATKCLQAAFDSGAAKVVIDRQAGDWNVEPVFLRTNQEVIIDEGVVVRALKGAYRHPNDCLFTVSGASNVVLRGMSGAHLRMERDDYADRKQYCFSEWRHALYIINSTNVRVSDIAVSHSGGDGIYVGGSSLNIDIRRVDCRNHYRQGISITSARNLVIADSRFTTTKGTPPQCGIDFEPNKPADRLSDCLVENCEFYGNASSGMLFHLTQLDETSEPISITIKNCRSFDNAANALTMTIGANGKLKPVKGVILIDGCRFAGKKSRAMVINGISRETASVTVKDTRFDARGAQSSGILINNNDLFGNAANLEFENCSLAIDKFPALEFSSALGGGVESIAGTLSVVCRGKVELFDFAKYAAENQPKPELSKAFGSSFVDFRELRPIAPDSIVKKVTPMCRGKFTFLQYLPKEGEYTITFKAGSVGHRKLDCLVQMKDMVGTDLGVFSITTAVQKVTIRTSSRNLRRFEIDTRGNTVAVSSPYPGQGLLANVPLSLFRESCRLYFAVPSSAEKVCVAVKPEEPVMVALHNAAGKLVSSMPNKTSAATLVRERKSSCVAVPEGGRPHSVIEVWSLDIKAVEDVMFRLSSDVTPIFATEATSGLRGL